MEAAHCIKLNVEKYGGMICAPWFDRPLSIAGRLVVSEGSRLVSKLVNVDRDLVMIPNLAIHMNRQVNDGTLIMHRRYASCIWQSGSKGNLLCLSWQKQQV